MPALAHEKVILALEKLAQSFAQPSETLAQTIQNVENHNAWFTAEQVKNSFLALSNMLNAADLTAWFKTIETSENPKRIGLILAGNIPTVGFHDVLCVLATGNIALIKLSSSDDKLLPALLSLLVEFEPALKEQIIYIDRLKDFDAVIATGSNNSSRYFDYYFSKVPHIIRKNRNSVAVLNGHETEAELLALGHDIFDYFGLGCRSVSKIYIPEDYQIRHFFEGIESLQPIINHYKYQNNYDYNKSIYLVNKTEHFDNGFLLLKEDEALASPLAVLYFEKYASSDELTKKMEEQSENIQCIISKKPLAIERGTLKFGESQHPKLWDYADNVNTIDFLNNL